MKTLLMMLMFISLPMASEASCFVQIEKGSDYKVSIWKHSEDQTDDEVTVKDYPAKELSEIGPFLERGSVTLIFNQGVFTVMKLRGEHVKRWAALDNGEKDLVTFVQNKFNVQEK